MHDALLEGRAFDAQRATTLSRGDSVEYVRATLGEPLTITRHHDGSEDWRYFARRRIPRWIHILSVQFRLGSRVIRSEAILRMRGGRLERFGKFEPETPE